MAGNRRDKKSGGRKEILLRYAVIIACILALAGGISWKLVDNTVVMAQHWNHRADSMMAVVDTIAPDRGDLLACDGTIIATNMLKYNLRIDYEVQRFARERYMLAIDSLSDSLATYFPHRTRAQWRKHLIKGPSSVYRRNYPILTNITYYQSQRIREWPFFKIHNSDKTGWKLEERLIRFKPYGDMARKSIGTVGQTDKDRRRIGRSGLERTLDSLLYGRPGYARREALNRGITNWVNIPPKRGYDVTTTIDIAMQDIVEHQLTRMVEHCRPEWASCVVMEVATGDIKAITNIEIDTLGHIVQSQNHAVLPYEPGSVVKLLSMLVALENGVVRDTSAIVQTASLGKGFTVQDSHKSATKRVSQVIPESSNIGISRIIFDGYGDDPDAFQAAVRRTGFLDRFNIGFEREGCAVMYPMRGKLHEKRLMLASQAYGYGTAIPPIYTLALYNAVANDGRFVKPRLVRELHGELGDTVFPVTCVRESVCSPANAAILRKMLHDVVYTKGGTAKSLRNSRVKIAGKTGTARIYVPKQGYSDNKRLAFCGFFPYDKPKYSCIVIVSHPTQNAFGAPSTSGQVFKNIAESFDARGLLDNTPDYRAHDEHALSLPQSPVFYASTREGRNNRLREQLGVTVAPRHIRQPQATQSGVPDVSGLDIREAIDLLESAGYNVDFSGSGYVSTQSPAPGTHARAGTSVTLHLSH